MRESLKLSGKVRLEHFSVDGKLLSTKEGSNIVTAAFKNLIALILASSGTKPAYMAGGSGSTTPTDADLDLETPFAGARTALTSTSYALNEVTYVCTLTATAVWALREIGIWNVSTAGSILARFLTELVTLQIGETLKVTWTINIGG